MTENQKRTIEDAAGLIKKAMALLGAKNQNHSTENIVQIIKKAESLLDVNKQQESTVQEKKEDDRKLKNETKEQGNIDDAAAVSMLCKALNKN